MFMLFTGLLGLLFWPLFKNLGDLEYREAFSAWVSGLGFRGVLILFGLQVIQIVAAVIPGGPIQVIAGAAFNAWGALLILQAGSAVASIIIFTLVRKFGNRIIIRFLGEDIMDNWAFLKDEKKTALICFILFLTPGLPKDTLTYIVAMTKFPLIQFLPISLIARFPAMFSSTLMGDAAMQGNWILFIVIFAVTAIAGILGIQFKDRIVKKLSKSGEKKT